jgi:hypothetical protein
MNYCYEFSFRYLCVHECFCEYVWIYVGVCKCVFVYVHNEFIYTHINSRLDYLKFKLIYLTNSNDKILTIIN